LKMSKSVVRKKVRTLSTES